MEDMENVKRITVWNAIGIRTEGRQKNICREKGINDLRKLKLRNWNKHVKDRESWNDLMQKTKTHVRL
jgi:hypothetical protein